MKGPTPVPGGPEYWKEYRKQPRPDQYHGVYDFAGRFISQDPSDFPSQFTDEGRPHHGAHPSWVLVHPDLGKFLVWSDYKGRGVWVTHKRSNQLIVGPNSGGRGVRCYHYGDILDATLTGIQEHGLQLLGFIEDE